jgi:nucleotide-binding universal stress UspA family protein
MAASPPADRTILVPLDGSALAERALPPAAHLARATGGTLLLLRVIPVATWSLTAPGVVTPPETFQRLVDEEDRAAREYLAHVAAPPRQQGVSVHTLALRGEAAAAILDLQPRTPVWLVVMATHGRTGLARFAIGSVADRIVRGGALAGVSAPVLLVRPFGEAGRPLRLERAVVPLDGSSLAELALEIATQLAGLVLRQVRLVRVAEPDRPAAETAEAQRYLEEVRARCAEPLAAAGCTLDMAVLHGRPAEQILEDASAHSDLVIMATHGYTGAQRWALGSIADKVLQGGQTPLLLVRPQRPI